MSDLLPCPWVDNDRLPHRPHTHYTHGHWRVRCSCGASGPALEGQEEAIADWNSREAGLTIKPLVWQKMNGHHYEAWSAMGVFDTQSTSGGVSWTVHGLKIMRTGEFKQVLGGFEFRDKYDSAEEAMRDIDHAYRLAMSEYLSAGALSQVVTWVPVGERLPDKHDPRTVYLVSGPDAGEAFAFAHFLVGRWHAQDGGGIYADVTHWAEPLRHPSELQPEGQHGR